MPTWGSPQYLETAAPQIPIVPPQYALSRALQSRAERSRSMKAPAPYR
ncbi:Uncharacterised protein [Vibrio cholerae]|nr:Uncharacterised protein [Vibrio cholerae]CSC04815.1 Uncharacterised protein [Vibrio cholerae]